MVKIRCRSYPRSGASGAARPQTRSRPAKPDAPECIYRRRRATPDLTIGPAEADQAGARPYLRRCAGTPRERIRFNLNLIRNKSLPVSPLLERFLDRSEMLAYCASGLRRQHELEGCTNIGIRCRP